MTDRERIDARVEVQIATREPTPTADEIGRWADVALGDEARSVCIRIVDEEEATELNARFRAVDRATNVLSFPAESNEYLGDIAICASVVAREAQAQAKQADDHYAHLVVHGVLHLLGHDHEAGADAERMEAMEIAILERLGVDNPYLIEGDTDV